MARTILNPVESSSLVSSTIRTELQTLETEIANTTSGHDHDGTDSKSIPATAMPSAINAAKIADGSVSNAEFQYLNGVTSAIQTQLNGKQASMGADDNYVTDAEKVVIGNTSGTNSGDNAANTNSGLVHTAGAESITGAKTFDKDKVLMKGTSTGVTTISTANTGATSYTQTMQAKNGTIACRDDVTYIGTTSVALNRASNALTLAGITLTTPDIGTPSAGTLTNCTGYPAASTTAAGIAPQATAPAAGLTNVVAIENGETVYKNKALFDATVPSTQAFGDAAAAGSAAVAARRDHKHAMPAAEKDTTAITGVLKGNGSAISACSNLSDVSYLPLAGGALTGAVTATADNTDNYVPLTITQNDKTNNKIALSVVNIGTGTGININQDANGAGLSVDKDVTNSNNNTVSITIDNKSVVTDAATYTKTGAALSITSGVTETSGTITDSAITLDINQTHADSTGNCVDIDNDGTGNNIFINQDGNGIGLNIDTEATTVDAINVDADAITTGSIARLASNCADATARNLVEIINDNSAAVGSVPLMVQQDAPTSTNYFKVATLAGVTLWIGNGNTANGTLSGTAGDILFNGGSNKPEYCTGTTNWTALV
jgi:trimeric autotransporter adhesin